MDLEKEIAIFNQAPEIAERVGLAKGIVLFEKEKQLKLPNSFKVRLEMFGPEAGLENMKVCLGVIHKYFVLGFEIEKEEVTGEYRIFETKEELNIHFSQIQEVPWDVLKFWIKQVERLEVG